jgi:hypothetical protein
MTQIQVVEYGWPRIGWMTLPLIALLSIGTAQAQRTDEVEFFLRPCNRAPTKVVFVLNGIEQQTVDYTTAAHWFLSLPEEYWFPIQDACASLRLGGARTDSRKAKPVKNPPGHPHEYRAQFTFPCDSRPAFSLDVLAQPNVLVHYERWILVGDTSECPSKEDASFPEAGTLKDIRFRTEKVLLHLGEQTAKRETLGVNINAMKLTENPKKKEYTFGLPGVAGLLALQRAKSDSSPPTLSSTAIDIDTARLDAIPLKTLTLTVN